MATADVIVGMVALLSGIVGSTGLWRVHRFFRALQEDHPEMWVTLGRPTLLGSFGDQDAIRRYLRRRQYRALGDPVLSTLGDTVLGIGDLADRGLPLERCVATVRRAIDAGLNVIDTAPGYEDGYSEQIVGTALRGVRERMFVIDKIDDLTDPVMPQLDASLERLQMDHVDAFVFHNLSDLEVFMRLMEPGGGFDQLADCVRAGKARFRGIASHSPDVLRAALTAGVCDVVMFPIGPFVDPRYVTEILPLAKRLGVGTVCFKTFGAGKLVGDTQGYNQPLQLRPRGKLSSGGSAAAQAVLPRLSIAECVHYTLTLDPDVALLGLSFPNEQDQAFAAAQGFTPLSEEEMEDIRRRAVEARRDKGPCWWNPDPEAQSFF